MQKWQHRIEGVADALQRYFMHEDVNRAAREVATAIRPADCFSIFQNRLEPQVQQIEVAMTQDQYNSAIASFHDICDELKMWVTPFPTDDLGES